MLFCIIGVDTHDYVEVGNIWLLKHKNTLYKKKGLSGVKLGI